MSQTIAIIDHGATKTACPRCGHALFLAEHERKSGNVLVLDCFHCPFWSTARRAADGAVEIVPA